MNKRKGFLEDLYSKGEKEIIYKLYHYLTIYDLDSGTVHGKVFYLLYLCNPRPVYEAICNDVGIGMSTLKAYKERYENLAQKLVQNEEILDYII